ncbi:ATP dependent PIM1 peptidase [Plasticicumulans lactativorans]|uniref:Lon protease n=1 Tax=Plasticicumulans lactativorans TaxID=1133106 RepID=A0A4R2KY37_9GAMM|nr:endopeptidase La [Plasticicumulans lactativorans]TCO78944.1 ATP dependent PIM1 peptidase [Plasticicumulans lactativorans]
MSDNDAIEAEIVTADDLPQSEIAVAADILPGRLLLLPLWERPFFPAQALPLLLNADPWLPTIERAAEAPQRVIGLVLVRHEEPDRAGPDDFYPVGTVVRMHHLVRGDGKIQFVAQGLRRFRIVRWISPEPPYEAQVEYLDEALAPSDELRAYSVALVNTIKELLPHNPLYAEELKFFLNRFNTNEPSPLADFAAAMTTASKAELQDVLDTAPVLERMKKVLLLMKKELEVAKLQSQIRNQVDERMNEQQRKFFLREQLKTIQQELGISKDDRTADVDRFRARLDGKTVPPKAMERMEEEFDKLSVLESGSPEYAVTRNYLDVLTDLPWGVHSTDQLDLKRARTILDRDHDGLDDVKERILEFLAVGALKGEVAGSILLLVGPPGVGKTSVGRSIANALGREFYRFSVGGMHDEAEIKGHRRTYIGAMPGKVIQAIRETGVANPVIMLDEIDKVGTSYRGDPASALLEVLDPEQNVDFLDHYLDVRFDLSKVLFVCTANQLDTIPGPLLDRMEVIRLAGYITAEKIAIARHHLWPRLLERSGVASKRIKLSSAALSAIIEGYAREAGVRNLEKQLGRIVRKAAVKLVEGADKPIKIGAKNLDTWLGKPPFRTETPLRGVGVVTGLAWTALGGATLAVEATRVHGKGRGFKLTGRLGEVMQESAAIAYSYVTAHAAEFGVPADWFDEAYLHLHVPEGATPKDGPSAGVTMASALLSLARGMAPPRPLAMTGELTLTGQVLAIGGVREKVIAARRVGIFELILPEANHDDFDELPVHIREGVRVHFARTFGDVAAVLFPPA